jgi:hypothetical protein
MMGEAKDELHIPFKKVTERVAAATGVSSFHNKTNFKRG